MTPPRVQRPPPDLEHVAVVGTSCAPPADDMLITRLVDKHMGVATPALASLIAAPADVECVLQGYAARDSRMESYSSSRPRIQALDQLMDFEDFEGEDQQPFGTIVSFLTIRDRILMSHTCEKLMDAWSLPTSQAAHQLLPAAGGFPHHSCTPSSPSVPQLFPSHAATQPLPLIYPRRKRKGEDWNHYMCELGMQCILDGDPLLAGFDEKGINNIRRALNRIRESDPSAYLKFQALEASLTEACIELQRDSMLY